MDIEKLNLDIRTFAAFKRAGINTVEDYLNYPDKDKLKSVVGSRHFEKFLEASKSASPAIQPQRAAEVSESFNYAVLTAELGDYLKHMEEKLRNEYMNFTANCGRIFAEAQEKLAKHGFGENNGVFEKWITSMGFKKSTVYEMIKIHQFRSSEIRTNEQAKLFDSLSKSLQYEVAKPSAPPKLVEQVMNGDITTHKEYIKLKKQLEEAEKKAAFWSKTSAETNKENQQLRAERVTAMNRADNAERKNSELEQRIKELEIRPVDVAVDVDELNRRVAEVTNKMNSEMEHTLAEERRGFADTLNAKDDRIWELEDELAELRDHNTELDFGDGSTPPAHREHIIEEFRRGAIDILCNVDLISEGFDVPDCECAILLRPTKSLTLFIQQSMRCMRYKPGKRAVIIDHVGNYARFGMPDDERKWTLEKRDKADRKSKAEKPVNARMCPHCYAVFKSADKCPKCGFVFPKQERQLETASAELQKIEGFKLDFSSPDECKSYGELLAYAKKHGYKQGWAYYQARNRGML